MFDEYMASRWVGGRVLMVRALPVVVLCGPQAACRTCLHFMVFWIVMSTIQ